MSSKKKGEREIRAAHRRHKKDSRHNGNDFDDFSSLNNQLGILGLSLKQVTGDGNCLFRAFGDQLEGNPQSHMKHRTDVVSFMKEHRDDFEPFVEDNITFDNHLRNLSELSTFGGNDSIVAFARHHSVTVVIHQLNKPVWQIHGGPNGSPCDREVHISYHNGDHYNSVRKTGDLSNAPARIKLASSTRPGQAFSNLRTKGNGNQYDCDKYKEEPVSPEYPDSGQESDYENSPTSSKISQLALEVERLSGLSDQPEILQALESNAYCVQATVDYLLTIRSRDAASISQSNLWNHGGTGSRIFGENVAREAVTGAKAAMRKYDEGQVPRTNQEKIESIQQKMQNKKLSNKRRKELKKAEKKLVSVERRNNDRDDNSDTEVVIANIEALSI